MSAQTPGQPGIIERALQLARNGPCEGLDDITKQLNKEHYSAVPQHMSGPSLRRQLTRLCNERRQREAQRAQVAQG